MEVNEPGLTDLQLIENYRESGEPDWLNQLLMRYQKYAMSIIAVSVGTHFTSEVEDIYQEITLKLMEKIGQFSAQSAFSTWLYRFTRNATIDYQRKHIKHYQNHFDIESDVEIDWSTEDQSIPDDLSVSINEYVESLPMQYRSVVYMYYWRGLKTREISQCLLISEGTVKSYLHRIRKQIAVYLESET